MMTARVFSQELLRRAILIQCVCHTTGNIKLVIAAKVDVRDGLAWSSLDQYIKNIEGVPASAPALPSHGSDPEAASVASAAVVMDSEEDADASAGIVAVHTHADLAHSDSSVIPFICFTPKCSCRCDV